MSIVRESGTLERRRLDDWGHHRRKVTSRNDLRAARRVVLKVGSSVLVREGALDHDRLASLVDEVAALREAGVDVALVTSGAIAAGCTRLGLPERPQAIPLRQAAAAVGQSVLMHSYEKEFARHGIRVGQVLLTQQVVDDRSRYLNARHTLRALFALGAVPIINENDTVATYEIGLGDNDRLSAIVAALLRADALVLLTNVEGLYDAGGPHGPPQILEEVQDITEGIRALASNTVSEVGLGGMRAKLDAARIATLAGASVVIASGTRPGTAARVLAGELQGTFFPAATDGLNQRRLWIAFSLKPRGEVLLDDGAVHAVCTRGESVLPVGIHEVRGDFREGDCVQCLDSAGGEIARGLAAYGARDARRIAGRSSDQIEIVLGYKNTDEVISRSDLVVTTRREP